jgi:RNase H-fold protein (predicted Holliday junction resolvase)
MVIRHFTRPEPVIAENQISMILIGIPLAIEGNDTPKTTESRKFMEMLSRVSAFPSVELTSVIPARKPSGT